MKILWFTNTGSKATVSLYNKEITSAGWISSLEDLLINDKEIELGICFNIQTQIPVNKEINNTKVKYYPIQINISKLKKSILKHFTLSFEEKIQEYLSVIDHFKPDLIHIFGTEGPYGLINKHVNIPIIYNIQGNLNSINLHQYKYFSSFDFIKQFSNPINILKDNFLITKKILKNKCKREIDIFKRAQYIIGRTEYDKRLSNLFAPNSKYFHLDEVLRPSFYKNKWQLKKLNDNIRIISVSGNENYKGFETILNTCKVLKDQNISFNWEIVGVDRKSQFINYCINKYNITPENVNIKFLGTLNENEIIKNLLNSHVYINTSHIENSSNSICEAAILGMPIIATNVGGTPSLITNEVDGILIHDNDYYHLAGTIIEIINNYDSYIEYGMNARKKSLNRHNKEEIITTLKSIYRNIISENTL